MLTLLLRTRLRYYRNYLRHHFDRRFLSEIILILLFLLYLVARSPADIGYPLPAFSSPDFLPRWTALWVNLLPLFYLVAEGLAWFTLRPSSEWPLLGSLPIAAATMVRYHLLRHTGKTLLWLVCGAIPFAINRTNEAATVVRLFAASGVLLALQLASFAQASALRRPRITLWRRIPRWLAGEIFVLALLTQAAGWLHSKLVHASLPALALAAGSWLLALALWLAIRRWHDPAITAATTPTIAARQWQPDRLAMLAQALILPEVLYLWRRRRSFFVLLVGAVVLCALVAIGQTEAVAAYAGTLFLQLLFGTFLLNSLLRLVEEEITTAALLRALPIAAGRWWRSRWWFTAVCLAVPMLLPAVLLPFKFPLDFAFMLFAFAGLVALPATLALLYCTAVFATFPHLRLAGLLLNVSLVLMFLFWFVMPLGTIILPAVALWWRRKSQRHFQLVEIA